MKNEALYVQLLSKGIWRTEAPFDGCSRVRVFYSIKFELFKSLQNFSLNLIASLEEKNH